MRRIRRPIVFAVLALAASAVPPARAQTPTIDLPVSVERIKKELSKPAPKLRQDEPVRLPRPTYRVHVEQRIFVPTLDEWIDKTFALTALQRQSAEWGAKCCGLRVGDILDGINKLRRERQLRRIRAEIARDLAAIEAARKKQGKDER
jgi:hypothetical protein